MPPPHGVDDPGGNEHGDGGGGHGGGRGGGDPWLRFDLPGIGYLVYDEKSESIGAHCSRHKTCRLNRSIRANARRPAQGRPLGQLIAWLQASVHFESQANHKSTAREEGYVSWVQRNAAREWAMGLPGFVDTMACLERHQRPDERVEPINLAG
jgi:hypothetical protein